MRYTLYIAVFLALAACYVAVPLFFVDQYLTVLNDSVYSSK